MSSSWVTLAAALIAAAAAVLNVVITRRGANGIELHKWRRQQTGELGARIITATHRLVDSWRVIAVGRLIVDGVSGESRKRARSEVKEAEKVFIDQFETIELAVAELDLLAGRTVAAYSSNLLGVLEEWRHVVFGGDVDDGAVEPYSEMDGMTVHVLAALFELVDVMRSDIGIEKRTKFRVKKEYRTLIQK